jgi:hypothetical protein
MIAGAAEMARGVRESSRRVSATLRRLQPRDDLGQLHGVPARAYRHALRVDEFYRLFGAHFGTGTNRGLKGEKHSGNWDFTNHGSMVRALARC